MKIEFVQFLGEKGAGERRCEMGNDAGRKEWRVTMNQMRLKTRARRRKHLGLPMCTVVERRREEKERTPGKKSGIGWND